jgi:hypothetical protein
MTFMAKHEPKPIGELNGIWSFLLRLGLVFGPVFAVTIIGFGVWVVQSLATQREVDVAIIKDVQQHAKELAAPRFTPADGALFRQEYLSLFRALEERLNWRNLELNPEQQRRKQP